MTKLQVDSCSNKSIDRPNPFHYIPFANLLIVTQERQQLQKKQAEYQKKQVSLTKEEEDRYLNECSELIFRIQILGVRLIR